MCVTHHTHAYAHAHTAPWPTSRRCWTRRPPRTWSCGSSASRRTSVRTVDITLLYIYVCMYKCARFRLLGLCTHMRPGLRGYTYTACAYVASKPTQPLPPSYTTPTQNRQRPRPRYPPRHRQGAVGREGPPRDLQHGPAQHLRAVRFCVDRCR